MFLPSSRLLDLAASGRDFSSPYGGQGAMQIQHDLMRAQMAARVATSQYEYESLLRQQHLNIIGGLAGSICGLGALGYSRDTRTPFEKRKPIAVSIGEDVNALLSAIQDEIEILEV